MSPNSDSSLVVRPVKSPRERRVFLTFPWTAYARDPLWVPPLLPERRKTVDPARGVFFRRGTAELFVAWRGGRPVGTICAAEDRAYNERTANRECMIGFFECIEGQGTADALFAAAETWARARGLTTLAGPFNLDLEDAYGVLVQGRDRPPVMLCGHTRPEYQGFFEQAGFAPLRGDNLAYEVPLASRAPALVRTEALARRVRQKGWITLRTPTRERWRDDVPVVQHLMNTAMAHLPDFRPWELEAVEGLLEPFISIADLELILFAEVEGKSIGWFAAVPNLNEILAHLNGLRFPWDYARLLRWGRYRPKCLALKSVLILPEYWGSGAALLLIDEMSKRARAKGYEWIDLSLTSADNPFTPDLAVRMGAKLYKSYRTYTRPVR
jgi:GNAT superfamily N-acetyltransferase